MRSMLEGLFGSVRPLFETGGKLERLHPLHDLVESFFLTPGTRTSSGAHVRDPMDIKRLMIFVLFALMPAILAGMWNVGHTAYAYEGMADAPVLSCLTRGAWHMLPIILVSYVAGGFWEMGFAVIRRHEINEGFLVTAMLFPLTLPPTIPLWMVALGISFGVVIGKEVFGGVGMNILNPALTARAFVFFAYPVVISGVKVWDVVGLPNPFAARAASVAVDAYTGATPLLAVAGGARGADPVALLAAEGWSWQDLFLGMVPGSMGEVSAVACLLGALFLVLTGIASWRVMVGCVVGLVGTAFVASALAGDGASPLMRLAPHYHLVMGGFAFGAAFMATDPVSSASTLLGQWIYGLCIGMLVFVIRVFNPAFPEGVMLAILLMNVFAPLIDYLVLQRTKAARLRRLASA